MKHKQVCLKVDEEDIKLFLQAIEKAEKETLIKLSQSSLVLWLIKRYLSGKE